MVEKSAKLKGEVSSVTIKSETGLPGLKMFS